MEGLLSSNLISQNALSGEPVYNSNLYLYNVGDENTSLTGGWVKTETDWSLNVGTITKNAANIALYAAATKAATCGVANTIDFTNYSKINLLCDITTTNANGSSAYIWIRTNKTGYQAGSLLAGVEFVINATSLTDKLITLDISSINQSAYAMVRNFSYTRATTVSVKQVWLEV